MYSIAPYNFSFMSICYSFCWINTATLHPTLYTIKAIRFSIISFIGFVRRRNQQLHLSIKYIQAAASITVHHCAVTQNFSINPSPDKHTVYKKKHTKILTYMFRRENNYFPLQNKRLRITIGHSFEVKCSTTYLGMKIAFINQSANNLALQCIVYFYKNYKLRQQITKEIQPSNKSYIKILTARSFIFVTRVVENACKKPHNILTHDKSCLIFIYVISYFGIKYILLWLARCTNYIEM